MGIVGIIKECRRGKGEEKEHQNKEKHDEILEQKLQKGLAKKQSGRNKTKDSRRSEGHSLISEQQSKHLSLLLSTIFEVKF